VTRFRHAIVLLLALLGALCALARPAAAASSVPAGFQEYHVLGHEEHVYDMFNRPVLGQFPLGFALTGGMISVVSVTASTDNQVVYYDHWEDGFEADIFAPAQVGSTLVFGNGIAADGRACDFIDSRACTGVEAVDDTVSRGETLTLPSSTIPSGDPAAPDCTSGGLTACVPIPRDPTDVRFDGGDRVVASGGPVTLVHVQEPTANLTGILGGALEVLPLQAVRGATSYSVPVGEDTFTRLGGTGTAGMPFRFVDLNLVAFEDGTAVQVSSPGAGTVNFVLDRGQHWSSQGAIDLGAGPALTINEGTKVSVSKPVAGLIFTSSTGFYGTRTYSLLPDLLHSNDYVITAPGDDNSVNGTSVHDLYVYNPSPSATITVTATDSLGSNSFPVPANAVVPYTVATGRSGIPAGSTVRLSSDASFWGISGYDSRNTAFDWGHSWLAVDFLTGSYAVPHAPDNANRTVSPPDPAAAPGSSGAGSTPAFAAATEDNTCVRVDFDNDGTFDPIRDGAGVLVPFAGGACSDGYLIDALEALRIHDNNAADGTLANNISGARVEATRPIAMAYGIDTDSSPVSGPGLLDLGYAIYPVDQRFLEPVLTIDKSADRGSVPSNLAPGDGTLVTYSLEVQAFAFEPLTNLSVTDLLPAQLGGAGACVDASGPGSGYVCDSTVITFPDLSTRSGAAAEPSVSVPGGRDQLTWDAASFAPKPAELLENETLLIQYQVRMEGGPSELLRNDARADANLGASSVFFTPTASASVVRTDVSLDKAVADDGTPEPGEVLSYTLTVRNDGIVSETGITVTDPIPANLSIVPGSVTSAGGLSGSFSAGQNAVTWSGSLAAGASAVVSFQARINPLAAAGTAIENVARYESNETESFESNAVVTTVVAPDLGGIIKTIAGDPAVVHPGEVVTYEITVANGGAATADNVLVSDPVSSLASYVPGSIEWRLNAAPFAPLTDAADGLEGGGADGRAVDTGAPAGADRIELRVPALGPGEDLTLRFRVQVNDGTGGQLLDNVASVQADNFAATDGSLVQVLIDGDATVTGHLFLDFDDDGVQDAGEPDLDGVDVVVTDQDGVVQVVATDGNGDWTVVVPADSGGSTTVDVDETDPDFPAGALLCSASPPFPDGCQDPQVVSAVSGATTQARNVGYVPQPITVVKSSGSGGDVVPGETVTYSIDVRNTSGVGQTGIAVSDALPAGLSHVPGSTQVSQPALRVTEYFLGPGPGGFAGTSFDLVLDQALANDYFVIVRGSDGDGSGSGGRGPDENYAALIGDPFGTGELASTGSANVIRLARGNAVGDWVGVVTVVESLPGAGADGFSLLDVRRVAHGAGAVSGSVALGGGAAWSDLGQVLLMGGSRGAGCDTAEPSPDNHVTCWTRLFPSGSDQVNWARNAGGASLAAATSTVMAVEWGSAWTVQRVRVQGSSGSDQVNWARNAGGASLAAATSTVMAVEWGSAWTVQRVRVQGSSGGDGADAASEYDGAAITPVARDRTWVWGTGHVADNGIGDGAEGVLIALGDGATQNPVESSVAAGSEFNDAKDFEVWAMTHPGLAVDHRFKPDGDTGETQVDVAVDAREGSRMALASSGQNGTGTAYPRPIFSARYLDDSTVRLERRRSGQPFPAWVQGIGFSGVTSSAAGGAPPALASGLSLSPGETLAVTFQARVDDPLDPGITGLTNTATVTSDQLPGGVSDSVIDTVLRLDVGVEPNSAGSVPFSALEQTLSFAHTITNRGQSTDSYAVIATSALGASGWSVALLDPATGVAIATDSDGDGLWDGGATPNTGSLAPGASRAYRLRVTVPAGAAAGSSNEVSLRAISDLDAGVTGAALDTVTVADPGIPGAGDVLVTPDNASSLAEPLALTPVVYTHTVTNRTGATRAFQLQANSSQGFAARIFRDTNGDGIFTAGTDIAIVQTASLADGASQRVFVVVDVPGGTPAGTVDTLAVAASFFDDGGTPGDVSDDLSFGGTATDTTTVTAAGADGDNAVGFTLSGGGTQVVNAGDTAVFPGQIANVGDLADVYEFTLSASRFAAGGPEEDGLPHPSRLVLDTDGSGAIDGGDAVVAEDSDGDGVWDTVDPGFDEDGDGNPDVALAAGASLPYELRRPLDPSQGPFADHVTLTAASKASGNSDSVTTTTSVQAPTLAVVDTLAAFDTGDGVVVQWVTASEHGTVGFTLERFHERRGRWQRVNRKLLPALLHSRTGGVYRLRDPRVRAGDVVSYRLRELEATGAVLEHGPWTVTVAASEPPLAAEGRADAPLPGYERVARPLDRISRARAERRIEARHRAALARLARRGAVVKVGVREPGIHRLRAEAIAEVMGLPAGEVRRLIRGNRLELRGQGRRVATYAEGGDALLFHAEPVQSAFSDENVYWLRRGRALRMGAVNARAPAPVPVQTYSHRAHAEGNRYYLTHLFDDPDDDFWMWDFRFEDMMFGFNEPSFPVPTPDPAGAGTATVTVRLHGGLEALHRARVRIEGAAAPGEETEWQGLLPHTLRFEVDVAELGDGETRIVVEGLGSGDPDRPSTFYVNDVTISYPRLRLAIDGRLEAEHAPRAVTTIGGFTGSEVMAFDVTRPARPRRLVNLGVDQGPAGTRASLRPRRGVERVIALEPSAVREPVSLRADRPSLLSRRDHSVDWLLITSADMLEAAAILADHRRAQGLRVMVVDVEDVYDEFAYGVRDADAIWRLLRHAHENWRVAPRYVVLAGEGSFDYLDHLGNGDSIIPTLLAPTRDGLFPSDNLFADVEGNDFVPEMAIGRLPVIDAAELESVARKLIDYEASGGDWTERVVLGADPPDQGGDFPASSAALRELLDATPVAVDSIEVDPLLLPMAEARALLHEQLNEGRAFFNFFGHAASGSLGNLAPGLVNAPDLLSPASPLANGERLPVVTAFTCLVGQFGNPGMDSVAELLLVAPDRGAAAVFSPSGLSRNRFAQPLGEAFYRATYHAGERVIGEAILRAQARYAERGVERHLLDIYNLLGDPATVMK